MNQKCYTYQNTKVSNMKISYSYSPEIYVFKDKIKLITISPLQSVDVYPATITEGFSLFSKKLKMNALKTVF